MIYLLVGERESGKTEFLNNIDATFCNSGFEAFECVGNCSNIAFDDYDKTQQDINCFIENFSKSMECSYINLFVVVHTLNEAPLKIQKLCKKIYFKREEKK